MSWIQIKKKFDGGWIPEYLRASTLFPAVAFSEEDNVFLLSDDSLGFGFSCQPLHGTSEQIQDRVVSLLNQDFPAQTLLQFTLFLSPDIQLQLADMQELRANFRDDFFATVLKERRNFLQKSTSTKIVRSNKKGMFENKLTCNQELTITCKVPLATARPTQQEYEKVVSLSRKLSSTLHTIGLAPAPMCAQKFVRILNAILNGDENASWKHHADTWDENTPLSQQLLDPDSAFSVAKDMLQIGESRFIKTLSTKKFPPHLFFGDAMAYVADLNGGELRLNETYLISATIVFPKSDSMQPSLERKRQFAVNQAYGPMLKFVPVLADKKDGLDIVCDSMNSGFKPLKINYTFAVLSTTTESVEKATATAITLWKERKFHFIENRFVHLPIFLNALPFGAERSAINNLGTYKTMTAKEAAVILPIFGEWKGTGTFHMALTSRNGQLMSLSLHDSDTNKNLVIAAETGSGKSFLANELICAYLSEGAQIWVIDAGKSYKHLCEIVNGDFVHFGTDSKVCLNPFELVTNYEDVEDSLISLVAAMASQKGLLDEWQLAALRQTMHKLWQEKEAAMTVDDIATSCLKSDDQRLRDVGMQLHVFTKSGNYGEYFSGRTNIAFKKQFTVLELDELQGRQHLRQVILLQLIFQIQQEVFLGDRARKKIVIVDEAWDLLKSGEVASFMEHAYRKFRKYGGSIVMITQSINDLYENSVGRAIAENSANMYLLGQTAEAIESVKASKRLVLSDGAFSLLKSVHTLPGIYSEIFVKSRHGIGVGRLVVGDFQKLLYSTDPEDTSAINSFVQQGYSLSTAILHLIEVRKCNKLNNF